MPSPKLTDETVGQIKYLLAKGEMSKAEIGRLHNTSRAVVYAISTGLTYADVPAATAPASRPIDQTNERIKELEGDVAALTDEVRRYERAEKRASKNDSLFRALSRQLEGSVVALPRLPQVRTDFGPPSDTEDVVMALSDGHHDQIITREESMGLEEHDFTVSCRRAETYVDKVIRWTQQTTSTIQYRDLWIMKLGDDTSGEIHGAVGRSHYGNMFKNSMAIGTLQSLMIRDLAPYFRKVFVTCVPGNHGRRSPKKDYHGAHNNWDYLISKMAQLRCADIDNVEFLIPDAFSVNLSVRGHGYNISHGDDVRSSVGVPFYGLARRHSKLLSLAALCQDAPPVRYSLIGHHHIPGAMSDLNGSCMATGAWTATDAYSSNAFNGYREPSQLVHGINDRGITWKIDFELKSKKDSNKTGRYEVAI